MKLVSATSSSFRHDINGLRAWAVVAVILYHFGIPGFSGGFAGVDVFFVISGYLMTGIVVAGLERGGFSLWAFYLARARRILPALLVLCAVLLALGWHVLLPRDFLLLGTHAVFSLAFLSNIKFWLEAGYFDAASHEKWLLHTWSLAVEWQFYLLLPLVLLAVWKLRPGRRSVTAVIVVLLLASLALCVVLTPIKPTPAFYLLPTRAWELLAGGLVFLMAHRLVLTIRQRKMLEAAGLGLILWAVLVFDASADWPGWRALVPVVGAALVLLASRSRSFWTGHFLAQWLGTRSYSLYLWHWPIVVALVYLERQADTMAVAASLVLTLVLGHLSYKLVETPAQQKLGKFSPGWGAATLLLAIIVVAAPGAGARLKEGVAGRFTPEIEGVAAEALNKNLRSGDCHLEKEGIASPSCVYGGENLSAVLIGDSHADAVITSIAAAVSRPSDGVMQWTYAGCPFLSGVSPAPGFWPAETKGYECGKFIAWAMQRLEAMPKNIPVVIVNRLTFYSIGKNEGLDPTKLNVPLVFFSRIYDSAEPAFLHEFAEKVTDTACRLAKDRPVYLVRPIPEMGKNVPTTLARAIIWGKPQDVSISLAQYHQRHDFVWAAQDAARDRCGVKILDPLPYLCPDGRCRGTRDGWPLYWDDNHLSEFGNRLLVPMFAEVFSQAARLKHTDGTL